MYRDRQPSRQMKRLTCCWHCLRPGDNLRREAGNAAHGAALQSEPSSSSELKMQRGRGKYTGSEAMAEGVWANRPIGRLADHIRRVA